MDVMTRILLAEDDTAERGLLSRGLAGDGHKVVEAENGQLALQQLLANPAGFAILRGYFSDESIHPLGLLVAALPPTLVAVVAFQVL